MASGEEWCARVGHSWRMILPDLDDDYVADPLPKVLCDECGLRLRTLIHDDY